MRKTAMSKAVKNYVKTTTLHGFKYLCSKYYIDRVGWLICCGASACCAGILCAVLWARFLEVPALLTLSDNISNDELMEDKIPAIIVCPTTENVAAVLMEKLSINETEKQRIPIILARLLTKNFIRKDQLLLLDEFLVESNLNLAKVMLNYEPDCSKHTKRCRYQENVVPCEELFHSELTTYGKCCTIDPKKLQNLSQLFESRTHTIQMLDLVLQYTQGSRIYGCELITMYDTEEDNGSDSLLPGSLYMVYQKFIVVSKNPATANLMKSTCVHRKGYSRTSCMLKCAEIFCGCRDLTTPKDDDETGMLPMCPVTRLECIRASGNNGSCHCLPPCKRITTSLVLDSSELNAQHTIDPFLSALALGGVRARDHMIASLLRKLKKTCWETAEIKRGIILRDCKVNVNMGLNATSSIVVKFRVNLAHSRKFLLIPTDTWVTLLSSLGGVFNMFLGVGLFSALEFLFLILIKLPAALKKSSEIDPTAEHASNDQQHHYNEYTVFPYKNRQRHQHVPRFDAHKDDRFVRY